MTPIHKIHVVFCSVLLQTKKALCRKTTPTTLHLLFQQQFGSLEPWPIFLSQDIKNNVTDSGQASIFEPTLKPHFLCKFAS
jgi:hypothetical protein